MEKDGERQRRPRSEERFSRNAETDLVCRLLLEKKTAAEFCGQLGGIDLVAAADADLRQPRTGFLEEDGQLLAADRVELIDGTVRLISRRPAVAQPGLADGSPDEPVTELEVQPLQDAALHPEGGGRPALEETPGHHHGVGAELDQLS